MTSTSHDLDSKRLKRGELCADEPSTLDGPSNMHHPKPMFDVLDKALSGHSKKPRKIFELDEEVPKIVDWILPRE